MIVPLSLIDALKLDIPDALPDAVGAPTDIPLDPPVPSPMPDVWTSVLFEVPQVNV